MFSIEMADMFGNPVWFPNGTVAQPARFGWAAVGGPQDAEIDVEGPPGALLFLLNWLNYRVLIRSRYGTPVWWGYVEEVMVGMGSMEVGLSLQPMYNRIAVAYTYTDESGADQRGTTEWVENQRSVVRYGVKELLYSRSDLDGEEAANDLAARLLDKLGAPVPIVRVGGEQRKAVLRCRGLWEKTGWRYYKQLEGKEANETFGAIDQVVGVTAVSGDIVFRRENSRIYQVGGMHGFKAGDKIEISGSGSNNGTRTITSVTRKEAVSYTATTISFNSPGGDDIRDSAKGFDDFESGDIIQVRGSAANSGIWQATTVEEEGVPGGLDYDHIEVAGGLIATEAAGPSVTINRYGYISVAGEVVDEGPGATVTIKAWGQAVAQAFSLEHDTADWPLYEVKVRARKQGDPEDSLYVSFYNDNAGVPGTGIETIAVPAADISPEYEWVSFAFSGFNTLTYGTTYWLVVGRSGSSDADDYYEVSVDEETLYARGSIKLHDGTTWRDRPKAASMAFEVLSKQDTGAQIKRILEDALPELVRVSSVTTGVLQYQYREGDDLAMDEVERLLELGTDLDKRLMVEIMADRHAYVRSRPEYTPDTSYFSSTSGRRFHLHGDGTLTDMFGRPVEPGTPVAGCWVQLHEPGLPDALADSFTFFVETAEYDVQTDQYRLTPESAPDPWGLAKIHQG